jgi:hypothetical protein
MRPVDISGKKFGKLTAISPSHINGKRVWKCRCDCNEEVFVTTGQLINGLKKSCGCLAIRFENLMGRRFGKLLVVEFVPYHKPGRKRCYASWRCLCDCGKSKIVRARHLKTGTDSCGCYSKEKVSLSRRLPFGTSTRNRIISSYKSNARKRGIEYHLEDDETIALFMGNCHYCGSPPSNIACHKRCYGSFTYNGIDRIDNTKGYVKGNVVSCCSVCNVKKCKTSYEDFIQWILKIANIHGKNNDQARA